MTLKLEQLEDRDTPAVVFNFNYEGAADSYFTPKMKEVVAFAANEIGEKLSPDPSVHGSVIDVNVTVQGLGGPLARGGPIYVPSSDPNVPYTVNRDGILIFDPRIAYHTGITELGIVYQLDLFTVTSHELLHVLGIGTDLNWADGSRARGVPIAPDGAHFKDGVDAVGRQIIYSGSRFTLTNIDLNALNDLGWNASLFPPSLGFSIVSIAGPDNLARQYVYVQGLLIPTGFVAPFHVIFTDLNYDGVTDIRITPIHFGYEYGIDGRTQGLIEKPGLFFGVELGLNYVIQKY